jgi:prepilin signal peptidase PulO-like enzyme (type II secretory pathway)
MDKTAQLVVGVLLVAFVIERVIAAITFFLDPIKPEERKRKLLVIGLSGVLAALALWKIDIRLMRDALHVTNHPNVDLLLTWLIVVGGADRIAMFAGSDKPSAGDDKPPAAQQPPITIIVEERDGKLTAVQER